MSGAGFIWHVPPSTLATQVEGFARRLLSALAAVGQLIAAQLEATARANAPWTDRTTQARRGLTAISIASADALHVYLFHAADHGKWLEIARGGPYKIIMPTIEASFGMIMGYIRALIGG